MMTRKTYTADNVSASGPYSHAVDVGDYVFFSGQTALNGTEDHLIQTKGNITEQTERTFSYLQAVMDEAGVTSDDIIKVNVYLTQMVDFDEMNEVYKTFFNAPYPARTCVAVQELPLHADVEIEAIAKRPAKE
jgi:2-iminobutanoate/2-iminopropanoate deaminase